MKQSEKEQRVMQEAKRLPKEIQPENDLWPVIRSALVGTRQLSAHNRAQSRVVAWRMAAAVALIAFSSLMTLWVSRTVPVDPEMQVLVIPEIPDKLFGRYNVLESSYTGARAQLLHDFKENLAKLSPETRETVKKNLAEIMQAVDEINEALAKDPSNTLLQRLLLAAFSSELEVYGNVNRISRMEMLRTDT